MQFKQIERDIKITPASHYAIITLSNQIGSQMYTTPAANLVPQEKDYDGYFREMQEKLDYFKVLRFKLVGDIELVKDKLK